MAKQAEPILRLTTDTMMLRAATALGKLDLHGLQRGVSMMSVLEIEAMALLLTQMGLTPIYPGEPLKTPVFITTRNKDQHQNV